MRRRLIPKVPGSFVPALCMTVLLGGGVPVYAADPVKITFEEIFNLPMNQDSLPPFTSKGVKFSGGSLRRSAQNGTWYHENGPSAIEMIFPPGATDISFEIDGYGSSIRSEVMPLQVWLGYVGLGTVTATVPFPPNRVVTFPLKHVITVPDGAVTVSVFTAPAPSGLRVPLIGNAIHIDNVQYTPGDPDPSFAFDVPASGSEKVLIHNYGSYPYPSKDQTQDRQIEVKGTVTLNGQPAGGKTIYFRLRDPEDTAPYVVQAGDHKPDDNVDGPGSLNGSSATVSAVSDAAGKISLTLTVTDHVAGDNYQVEGSIKDTFPCGASCPKSAVYTAWKRVYVEVNKMFRKGAYITARVVSGAKDIEVSDINQFPEPPFDVRLVHAPQVVGGPQSFYSELVTVTKKRGTSMLPFGAEPGVLELDRDPAISGVQNDYSIGETVGKQGQQATYRPFLADAVGLVTGNRGDDFWLANGTLVNRTFAEAFTEHVWLTDAIAGVDGDLEPAQPRLYYAGVLPFDPKIEGPGKPYQSEWMARKWMRHAARVGHERVAEPNHQVLFTATNHPFHNGVCRVGSNFNDLWLFVRQIGNSILAGESLVHELTHEWRVNQVNLTGGLSSKGDGHCNATLGTDQKMYNRNLKCTMHSAMYGNPEDSERNDGVVGFHYVKIGSSRESEYLRIRQRDEPVPQNDEQRLQPE